jgi:tetratricopeptide (TPR) repeat protein
MRRHMAAFVFIIFVATVVDAQVDKISIAAGTPEDKDLTAIGNEQDAQKKITMYQDFLQKYASNPSAVAYANWQLSQSYQTAGDMQKALDYGDKALTGSPHNVDILMSQVTIAQQLKDNPKIFQYAVRGGDVYDSIEKQAKPADMSDEQFANSIAGDKDANKNAYQFFQGAAFNSLTAETDAKNRMDEIEKFSTTFPKSGMDEQLTSYAMLSLSELKDTPRLIAYGEKALAANPNNLPVMLMLANTYVDSSEPGAFSKAASYAEKAILAAKADEPDADKPRKISAGIAHSTLGRVYAKQEKTSSSISELKSATSLLKGQDEQQYAIAAYFLGWDYAKSKRLTEARAILSDSASIPGPMQAPTKELLAKVNSARAAGK